MRLLLKRLLNRPPKNSSYKLFGLGLPVIPSPSYSRDPALPMIGIATPVKDAEKHLDRFFDLVAKIDYPKHHLHFFFLEGDSQDDTLAILQDWKACLKGEYAGFDILKQDHGFHPKVPRQDISIQRERRSILAKCRNALLRATCNADMGMTLFIDVDLCEIPTNTLEDMLHFPSPIAVANCYKQREDLVFDRNTFRYVRRPTDAEISTYLVDGIYQPGRRFPREYPDRFKSKSTVQVHSVGGTFLLIDQKVIKAGVTFPEDPYRYHIETEGFALKALDHGFGSFVFPNLIVRHVDGET